MIALAPIAETASARAHLRARRRPRARAASPRRVWGKRLPVRKVVSRATLTGHDHVDSVGLIHMNGRAYDPELGRFTGVDPFMQAPLNSQSLNPYSYVMNNPIAGTDPTGYRSLCKTNVNCETIWVNPPGGKGGKIVTFTGKNENGAKVTITVRVTSNVSTDKLEDISLRDVDRIGINTEGEAPRMIIISGGTVGSDAPTGAWTDDSGTTHYRNENNTGDAVTVNWGGYMQQRGNVSVHGVVEDERARTSLDYQQLRDDFNFFAGMMADRRMLADSMSYFGGMGAVRSIFGWSERQAAKGLERIRTPYVNKSANQLGREGEEAVRAMFEIGGKRAISINGRARIPDGLTDTVLSEVKNVSRQSYTRQLRDFADYASQNGLRFDLYVRPDTRLSGPLMEAVESGTINLRFIPQ